MNRIAVYDCCSEGCLGSDLGIGHMAEDQSRTSSLYEAGSSSKDLQEERDEGWLQLGIGGYITSRDHKRNLIEPTARRGELVELDLLSGGSTTAQHVKPLASIFHVTEFLPATNITSATSFSTPLFLQHPRTSSNFPQPEVTWGYRPNHLNVAATSASSFLPPPPPPEPHIARPYQGVDVAGLTSNINVVDAPWRPHSGVWFILQSSQKQAKEPFLPQIPKSYLRIKNGRMTVRLLKKYLINKLKLDSESEIEITCSGQELLPSTTLQHVRDNIWGRRREWDGAALLADSSTTDHVMVLHYGRTA
ncbi:hypothetical protein HHK36_015914 [Tetracentron sinense]|uniref:RAWUL domain-containing protein n=1 Tax=Tetracentron sinense TaxID=13715 RepID=A0A834Z3Z2_TETSI|nr:hypothetical protein HHK36_015914 [Tetracentron sinense]